MPQPRCAEPRKGEVASAGPRSVDPNRAPATDLAVRPAVGESSDPDGDPGRRDTPARLGMTATSHPHRVAHAAPVHTVPVTVRRHQEDPMTIRPNRRALMAVAAAAIALTACGEDEPEQGAPEQTAETVAVVGQDTLTWDADELAVDAGTITVELTCEGGVNHNFVIEETGEDVVDCAPGESATGTVDLDAGVYEYVCTVPGHESTMRGTLTVN